MTDYTYMLIFFVTVFGLVKSGMSGSSHDEDEDKLKGLTIGQIAAIAIGGAVCLALIIIAIVAIVKKCKDKPEVKPEEDKCSHTANALYDELPPKYSLRAQGPSNEVYLPPYPGEEKKIKLPE